MNCQEALSLLYDVIDKEASEIDAREVEKHLKNCQDCAGVYRLEQSVNELIKRSSSLRTPAPELMPSRARSSISLTKSIGRTAGRKQRRQIPFV